MALSVVDLYKKVLPGTNCRDCGFPSCLAFAGMVVSEQHPLADCPHIAPDVLAAAEKELFEQYSQGKWLKKDMAREALELAREKATSMDLYDIAARIGGTVHKADHGDYILLPYFNKLLTITRDRIQDESSRALTRNEQTFVYIHMASGSNVSPSGQLKSLKEFPNTVSKIKSMESHIEAPLKQKFSNRLDVLATACESIGGKNVKSEYPSPDLAYEFIAMPKIPVTLLFWDENDGFEAEVKLLFDETIILHLDIESIMFLCEHLAGRLINFST